MRDKRRHRFYPLIIVVAGVLGGGFAVTSWFPPGEWYSSANYPDWHPSGRLVAMTLLAVSLLSALAAWLVWRRRSLPASGPGLFMWLIQFLVAITWWWVFFGLHRPGWALGGILLLWLATALTIVLFHGTRRLAAWLMVPWLIWITIAAALNYEFWRLNGGTLSF